MLHPGFFYLYRHGLFYHPYSGTFGLLLKAKQSGVLPAVKLVLDKIRKTDFRFSNHLFKVVPKEAGE